MQERAVRARATLGVQGAVGRRLRAPAGLSLCDVARLAIALVLLIVELAAMAATGTFVAGPVPVEGPAPGFAL